MTLFTQIKTDQLAARKAKRALAATLLTTLIGEVSALAKNDGNREVTDADVVKLVKKFLDGVNESIEYMEKAQNTDALTMLHTEAAILSAYMPQQMDEAALTAAVKEIIATVGNNMGKVMGELKARFAGQYDGQMASKIVKSLI